MIALSLLGSPYGHFESVIMVNGNSIPRCASEAVAAPYCLTSMPIWRSTSAQWDSPSPPSPKRLCLSASVGTEVRLMSSSTVASKVNEVKLILKSMKGQERCKVTCWRRKAIVRLINNYSILGLSEKFKHIFLSTT